jgi:hypothetical protein
MKPIKSLLVFSAIMLAPALAAAQPYYGPAPAYREPGGFHHRANRLTFGISFGVGGMHDGGSGLTGCDNCNYNPLAGEIDGHIGGMLNSRLALLFEAQANIQNVHSDAVNGDTTVTQSTAMVALQYWLAPILWVKGGLGFAHLSYDNNTLGLTDDVASGGAIMGAIGVELLSGRRFAMDLQGRIIEGEYNSLGDHVTSGTIGLGFNWY